MQGIKNAPYAQIYEDVKKLPEEASVYYDKTAVNTALVSALPDKVKKIEGVNPTLLFKAKKNPLHRSLHIKNMELSYTTAQQKNLMPRYSRKASC